MRAVECVQVRRSRHYPHPIPISSLAPAHSLLPAHRFLRPPIASFASSPPIASFVTLPCPPFLATLPPLAYFT
ncbi:hypothetical protein K523DRAFT_319443 [Schizophyllum commune Tattone D]|nr:hypothetical protein K523DRAFT_319443 [Schizophyllum commune Tattone D]